VKPSIATLSGNIDVPGLTKGVHAYARPLVLVAKTNFDSDSTKTVTYSWDLSLVTGDF
jgi:hypothetical protein